MYHLDPESEIGYNILSPRIGNVDSKIINIKIVSLISTWIDKLYLLNTEESYFPYNFELLLRWSRDGFTPEAFHKLCDNKHSTVTFIKVKGTGGYNPLIWKSTNEWGKTKDSFLFSLKNKDILSKTH